MELEAQMGRWPRRLLHVPTMHSYPWQPGHKYGHHVEPRYNAISYTWGRFELEKGQIPRISGLDIGGVEWDIPRITPEHFSRNQLREVLDKATGVYTAYNDSITDSRAVEFVWLDIACIDQRFNTESMLEIGRQAKIFSNALCVYIWLTETPAPTLEKIAIQVDSFWYRASECISLEPKSFHRIQKTSRAWRTANIKKHAKTRRTLAVTEGVIRAGLVLIQTLIKDPWFSSLWTLQESYLCKRAIFVSREASFGLSQGLRGEKSLGLTLETVLYVSSHLCTLCRRLREVDPPRTGSSSIETRLLELVQNSGLTALKRENPMELYSAALSRKPRNKLDSIYGIMQVFDFRLGASDPELKPGTSFTLSELEAQFGAALIKFSPILSQGFVHTAFPREIGSSWHPLGQLVSTGHAMEGYVPWTPDAYIHSCVMECRRVDGVLWGYVQGRACSFDVFQEKRSRINAAVAITDGPWRNIADLTWTWTAMDWAPDLFSTWQSLEAYDFHFHPAPMNVAEQLLNELDPRTVQVFYMGSETLSAANSSGSTAHFGLLLKNSDTPYRYWRRLGICGWTTPRDPASKMPVPGEPNIHALIYLSRPSDGYSELLPTSSGWEEISGLFG